MFLNALIFETASVPKAKKTVPLMQNNTQNRPVIPRAHECKFAYVRNTCDSVFRQNTPGRSLQK